MAIKVRGIAPCSAASALILVALASSVGAVANIQNLGAGARSASLGNAFVAVADDGDAVFANPAGLGQVNQRQLAYSNVSLLYGGIEDDNLGQHVLSYTHPLGGKLAVGLGGFAAGAYVAMRLAFIGSYNLHPAWVLLAGVAGAVLLFVLFDWALIALSSMAGAALVIEGVPKLPLPDLGLFWGLAGFGVVIQTVMMIRKKFAEPPKD